MSKTKSVGAIIINDKNEVLLVYQKKNNYWVMPKGTMEPGEKEMETLKREIAEETGLADLEIIEGFRESIFYQFYGPEGLINKEVVYYLIKTKEAGKIIRPDEILEIKWCDFKEANQLLNHDNYKNLLKKVNKYISQ